MFIDKWSIKKIENFDPNFGGVGSQNIFDQWFSWPRKPTGRWFCKIILIDKWDKKDCKFWGRGSKKLLMSFGKY